jgi:WhiB family transcriptional regulator, redox-sensing transcriptional regulator
MTRRPGEPVALSLGWASAGLCHQPDHAGLPWVDDACTVTTRDTARMTRVCRVCPVRAACGTYADQADVTAGFWAGAWHTDNHQETNNQEWTPDPVPVEWVPVKGVGGVVVGEQAALDFDGLGGAA